MSANHPGALLIFAKWPEAGKVKTRLSPPLSAEDAAALYRCMLLDTVDSTKGLAGIDRFLCYDGEVAREADFMAMAPDVALFRQSGRDLGERLDTAFAAAFGLGYRRVAVIGTDAPHTPASDIGSAFSLLAAGDVDIVFGPTVDGGYYLLGMKELHRELFRDIPWSSRDVLQVSIDRAESAGLKASLLGSGFDLDTIEDLKRLAALQHVGLAGRTRRLVKSLGY